MQPIDIFATKGAEYLFAGAFLLALVAFWKLVNPPAAVAPALRRLAPWFQLRDDAFFHQGHGWVVPAGRGEALVGMDDFAQKLLGKPGGLRLPAVGAVLKQGEAAWQVQVDGHPIPMLSPVDGEVVAINEEVLAAPELVNTEPYDRGWLMRVKVPNPAAAARNLLSGKLARAWMDGVTEEVRALPAGELGVVLPDGGFPVGGFARALVPEGWEQVARELLLSA